MSIVPSCYKILETNEKKKDVARTVVQANDLMRTKTMIMERTSTGKITVVKRSRTANEEQEEEKIWDPIFLTNGQSFGN